jgi:hypothetical protein
VGVHAIHPRVCGGIVEGLPRIIIELNPRH